MKQQPFLKDVTDRALCDLIVRYDLEYAAVQMDADTHEVTYKNATSAVRVDLDSRENRVYVSLFRVYDDIVPAYRDINARKRDPLNGFDVDDLISLRSPGDRISQATPGRIKTAGDVEHIVYQYAAALQNVADDVLRGNFSVFFDLATIIVRRIENAIAAGYPPGPEYESILLAYGEMNRPGFSGDSQS